MYPSLSQAGSCFRRNDDWKPYENLLLVISSEAEKNDRPGVWGEFPPASFFSTDFATEFVPARPYNHISPLRFASVEMTIWD
jgi:hypothetical protein